MSIRIRSCKRCAGAHVASDAAAVTCLGSHHAVIQWDGGAAPVTRQQAQLMAALFVRPGCIVSTADLIDHLWGHDAEGGPLGAPNHVHVVLCRLRAKLAAAAFPGQIMRHGYRGWELAWAQAAQAAA